MARAADSGLPTGGSPRTHPPTQYVGGPTPDVGVQGEEAPLAGADSTHEPQASASRHKPPEARERESRCARQRSGARRDRRERLGKGERANAREPASSPERGTRANRDPHLLDQPEASPCGTTRKPERLPRPRRGRGFVTAFACPTNAVSTAAGSNG
jgi:hypothetical protein